MTRTQGESAFVSSPIAIDDMEIRVTYPTCDDTDEYLAMPWRRDGERSQLEVTLVTMKNSCLHEVEVLGG